MHSPGQAASLFVLFIVQWNAADAASTKTWDCRPAALILLASQVHSAAAVRPAGEEDVERDVLDQLEMEEAPWAWWHAPQATPRISFLQHFQRAVGAPGGSQEPMTAKEKEEKDIALGLSIMFVGVLVLVCCAAWMINYPKPQVKVMSKKIVSSTAMIFIAVTIEHAAVVSQLVAFVGNDGKRETWEVTACAFFFYWVLTIILSFMVRFSHVNLIAAKSVASHVAAFVAIFTLSDIFYEFGYTKGTMIWDAQLVFAVRVVLWLGFLLFFLILHWLSVRSLSYLPFGCELTDLGHEGAHADHDGKEAVASGDSLEDKDENEEQQEKDKDEKEEQQEKGDHHHALQEDTPESVEHFIEEIDEALEEAIFLALSYIFCKFVVAKSILELLELKHAQDSYTHRLEVWVADNDQVHQAIVALFCTILCMMMVLVGIDRLRLSGVHMERVTLFLSMCIAWSSMRMARFIVMIPASEETSILIMTAFLATPFGAIMIIVIDWIADKGVLTDALSEQLALAFGFMIGFSWEKAFAAAIHLLQHFQTTYKSPTREFSTTLAVSCVLILIIFPGWRYMILPHAMQKIPPRMQVGTF